MSRCHAATGAPVALTLTLMIAGCGRHDLSQAAAAPSKPAAAAPSSTAGRADVSEWASQLLVSADTARQAIARHDKRAAAKAVNEAIGFSDKLGGRLTAPIYTELSSVSVIGPIQAAKAGTAASRPTAVKAVAGGYTRIVLDVNLARARLLAARDELAANDLARADTDLRAIQGGVVLESVSANLPLLRARDNLALARTSAQGGKTAAAKSQLQAAERALSDFARLSPASPHAAQARALATQMAGAADGAAPDHPLAATQLDGWWSQIAAWTDEA